MQEALTLLMLVYSLLMAVAFTVTLASLRRLRAANRRLEAALADLQHPADRD
jgi:hypothetical protein